MSFHKFCATNARPVIIKQALFVNTKTYMINHGVLELRTLRNCFEYCCLVVVLLKR